MAVEQRKHARFLCTDGGALRLSIRPEFRGRKAVPVDVSSGGIGFVNEEPLECGTVIVFELQSADGLGAVNRIARVRYCQPVAVPENAPWLPPTRGLSKVFRSMFGLQSPLPEGLAWHIGCEFDQPLTENEIKQLFVFDPSARVDR